MQTDRQTDRQEKQWRTSIAPYCNVTFFSIFFFLQLAPTMDVSLTKAIADIKNPTKLCERVHELVTGIVEQVQDMDTQLHGECL